MTTVQAMSVEPLDDGRCVFTLDRPLLDASPRRFRSSHEAAGVPVAEAVLAVPGVAEVTIAGATLTAATQAGTPWQAVAERVQYAIETALAAASAQPRRGGALDDDAMFATVERVFSEDINPAIARHGGRVELVDVQDGTVVLRMFGGCQGCGMAAVTLRQGIEGTLRQAVPGFKALTDITDHSSGSDPYFK